MVKSRILALLVLTFAAPASAESYFRNCAEAQKYGYTNILRSSPFYDLSLDRDRDGIACETDGGEDVLPKIRVETVSTVMAPYIPSPSSGNASAVNVDYDAASPPMPEIASLTTLRVVKVIDGSHVVFNKDYKDFSATLIGIRIPAEQAERAKAALASALPANTLVFVEYDVLQRVDGQVQLYIWLDRTLLNSKMVSAGFAVASPVQPNIRYANFIQAAQEKAQR